MRRRHIGVPGVQDQRHAHRLEALAGEFGSPLRRRRRHLVAEYVREADTGLLEYGAAFQYAAFAAAAALPIPVIVMKLCATVEILQRRTDTQL